MVVLVIAAAGLNAPVPLEYPREHERGPDVVSAWYG